MTTQKTSKFMSQEEAVQLIADGSTIAMSGFVTCSNPDYISAGIEQAFLRDGHPRDLTLVHTAGIGDGQGRGADRFAHEGMLTRVVAGHYNFAPTLQKLIIDNKVQAYNLPQGTLAEIIRDGAGGRPGTTSKIGLGTFVDPRNDGGKMNAETTEDLVEVQQIFGEDWLFYHRLPINVALVKATYADEDGNISGEHLPVWSSVTTMAQAAYNNGGVVIVQVDALVGNGTLDPRMVKIPGFMVSAVVVAPPEEQFSTVLDAWEPAFCGETRVPLSSVSVLPLNQRKIIARRAYQELGSEGGVVNLGIGMPEGVAAVAVEEDTISSLHLTVESGISGGIPESGLRFGAALNPDMIVDEATQFDFYDGGGLDATFIGLAQMDKDGNINVSRFGPQIAGCGGAINITQTAKRVVFCGTFTVKGLKVDVADGELKIIHEGAAQKLLDSVEQVTFSGTYARETGQRVMYITERAVFEMQPEGLTLVEIAPGIDLERDVIAQMGFRPRIAEDLRVMDARIFADEPLQNTPPPAELDRYVRAAAEEALV